MAGVVEDVVMRLPEKGDGSPIAIVAVGMAGAGKTTFVTALWYYLAKELGKRVYCINLDPAVSSVPFPTNIDIRDSVDYMNTIKHYGLGPNGAIMTCLNLYATKWEQVLCLIEKRRGTLDYVLIDTPGQIEVFNWSASGTIILDSIALAMPTIIAYTIDTVRCQQPITMMSNLIYACSVLYKSKVPFLCVYTKTDIMSAERIQNWMANPNDFADATNDVDTYAATLAKSCCLTLASFYEALPTVSVSVTNIGVTEKVMLRGFDQFLEALAPLADEYFDIYLNWIQEQRKLIKQKREEEEKENLRKMTAEMSAKRVDQEIED